MKKKDFGWVIQNKKTKKFLGGLDESICMHPISKADLAPSRREARLVLEPGETVRKVSLTKTGKPKKIIGRG